MTTITQDKIKEAQATNLSAFEVQNTSPWSFRTRVPLVWKVQREENPPKRVKVVNLDD